MAETYGKKYIDIINYWINGGVVGLLRNYGRSRWVYLKFEQTTKKQTTFSTIDHGFTFQGNYWHIWWTVYSAIFIYTLIVFSLLQHVSKESHHVFVLYKQTVLLLIMFWLRLLHSVYLALNRFTLLRFHKLWT